MFRQSPATSRLSHAWRIAAGAGSVIRLRHLLRTTLAAGLLFAATQAPAHRAHVHGIADAEVTLDGERLTVLLRIPLDSLVGFETAPRTALQRERIRTMAARLHQPADLVVPTPAGACEAGPPTLASPVIAPDLLAPPPAGTGAGTAATPPAATRPGTAQGAAAGTAAPKGKSQHADLEATWTFACRPAQAVTGVSLDGLFSAFDGLREIRAAIVTDKGQSGAVLVRKRSRLSW